MMTVLLLPVSIWPALTLAHPWLAGSLIVASLMATGYALIASTRPAARVLAGLGILMLGGLITAGLLPAVTLWLFPFWCAWYCWPWP
jgi:hypothetical protein